MEAKKVVYAKLVEYSDEEQMWTNKEIYKVPKTVDISDHNSKDNSFGTTIY